MSEPQRQPASFRDPDGFLFTRQGVLYRQVNRRGQADFDRLIDSGLYRSLADDGLLVTHEPAQVEAAQPEIAYRVLKPARLPFVSYPYEWCFGQLKAAALATLDIQKRALAHGMSLKDASAYNIQFVGGRPQLVDTLSFSAYREGEPWAAYRQFCQHFLAPLALMARLDVRLGQLLRVWIDGLPLDLASRLLPRRTRLNPGLLTHIHLHAGAQRRFAGRAVRPPPPGRGLGRTAFLGLLDSLEGSVRGLRWDPGRTAWADYYEATNYTPAALQEKEHTVAGFLDRARPASVWDLGANTGRFSRLASGRGIRTLAFDSDPGAVEIAYREARKSGDAHLLPLWVDLTNPSPGLGWAGQERESLLARGPADLVLALALLHHLAIGNNLPLERLADFLARLGRWLIVEFVPKSDSQVQRLLAARPDIFESYHRQGFEAAFGARFVIHEAIPLRESERLLYLMETRSAA